MKKTKKNNGFNNIPLKLLSSSVSKTRGVIKYGGEGTAFMKGDYGDNYICQSCNSVLIYKNTIDKPLMLNGAIICNKCNKVSALDAISELSKCPIVLSDLITKENRVNNIKDSFLWHKYLGHENLKMVNENIFNIKEHKEGSIPLILYHYTSYAGMIGMISSGKVWLTDIGYLNDTEEMTHGIEFINNHIENIKESSSDIENELIRRSTITTSQSCASEGYYIMCFCSNNDLLSQWRAYGSGGGGYSFGFNSLEIEKNEQIQIRKVIYNDDDKREIINTIYNETLKSLTELTNKNKYTINDLDNLGILPEYSQFLRSHLDELAYTFKHSSFLEENEWRVMFKFSRYHDINDLLFRDNKNFPIPYLNKSLNSGDESLPLVSITVGPTLNKNLTEKSIHLLLEKYKYDFVEVIKSGTPFRG